MSPDIEWHIGDGSEQETIVKTQSKPPSRLRKFLIGVMIVLGVGLSVIYSRRPESPQLAQPTAVPTDTPEPLPPLAPAIEREARALASGDMDTFLAMQDPADTQWRQDRLTAFSVWGTPRNDTELFTILDSGIIQPNRAWADVIQYRDGQYFREMRFYRVDNDDWVRTQPDLSDSFWGDEQTAQTAHFDLVYREHDADQARFVADQLEASYTHVCDELGCPEDPAAPRLLKLVMLPEFDNLIPGRRQGFGQGYGGQGFSRGFGLGMGQYFTVTLPSPSLAGLYYRTLDTGEPGQNAQIDSYFNRFILSQIMYLASGGFDRWGSNRDGFTFVTAVSNWERTRRGDQFTDRRSFNPDILNSQKPLSLDALWSWSSVTQQQRLLASSEASALIKFIDEQYGADTVLRFFRGLRYAQSLPHLIEITGLPYSEFESKWEDWLKQYRNANG